MRFRARVQRPQVPQLQTFVKALSELGAKCALLYLAQDSCKAIVKTENDALLLWGTLQTVRAWRRGGALVAALQSRRTLAHTGSSSRAG